MGHHGVAVHQPQDHAGHERAEDGLQAEPLGQRDEPDQEHHRAPHPDLLAEPEWKPAYIIRGLRDLRVSL
ncbi:MAG: hypothetical protein M3Q23_10590 [Actinomycetota bacterium]|nr:hypothetical protein [Actinomycetota bacterium]